MASLNLLQWREQSLWLRYRALHCLGILLLLVISFFAVQWVTSYGGYLSNLKQQLSEQSLALEKQRNKQQRWEAFQKEQQKQQAFSRRKLTDQRMLNAVYALLDKTHQKLNQRELSISHSQLELTAQYQQIQQIDDQYLWLQKQLLKPGLKQQLLPRQGVLFYYTRRQNEAEANG